MAHYRNCPNILFDACWKNQTEIVKECIKSGYEINKQNCWFQTALIIASEFNNLNDVKILIENGADLNIIDMNGSTALGYAKDKSEVQQYLTNKGAKCLKNSSEDMSNLKIEIENKSSVSSTTKEIFNKIDSWGFTPFMWAVWHQSEEHFKYYLNLGADVNQKCRNGTTPLMTACFRRNFNMVEKLIEKGALVNDIDHYGNSPLIYCTNWPFDSKIADFLISKGADINNSGINRPTPLIAAAISWDLLLLEYFLNKKANVNAIDDTGNTTVAYASYSGKIAYVKMLIENKADLDLCGPKGKTPLSWAATTNNLKMVELLLTNGAKVNQKDYQNNTALSYAKQYGHDVIIKYLEKKIQEVNPLSSTNQQYNPESAKLVTKTIQDPCLSAVNTPLCSAIQQNNFKLVKLLVENDDEDTCKEDSTGNTPLMTATRTQNQEIVKFLLKNGAELTVHSALPIAIEVEDLEILKILIENGANVNRYFKSMNQTPLMQAISLKNMKIVQFLVENGADPNLNTLRTAIELKWQKVVKYLIEKGADVNAVCPNQPSLLKLAIDQKNLRLIVLLVNHGANVKNDIKVLEEFAKENDDFQEFFIKKIRSPFKANKEEIEDETN